MTAILKEVGRLYNDIPSGLRALADSIEQGQEGDAKYLVWALMVDEGDMVSGLLGAASEGDAHYLHSKAALYLLGGYD